MITKNFRGFLRHLSQIPGWHTTRQIVVFESDDWGSIRMPSKTTYQKLLSVGISVDRCPYNRYDSLETADDLSALYEVLRSHRDKNMRNPVVTINTIMANPDFIRIKEEKFERYYLESFLDTYLRISGEATLPVLMQGIDEGLVYPQLHGREHLNALYWLSMLRSGHRETLSAFDHGVFGHPSSLSKDTGRNFTSAFDTTDELEERFVTDSIVEAGVIFSNTFGHPSKTFIAPRFIWNRSHEFVLKRIGVDFLQGKVIQLMPVRNPRARRFKYAYHYLGQKNKLNQRYLVRNCFFEPSQNPGFDWISDVMQRMKTAFFWGKPAVISVHRLNFMGGIEESNRSLNLKLFDDLLTRIIKMYPQVEFIHSEELGLLIDRQS